MIVWFVVFWVAYYQLDLFRSPQERIEAAMTEVNDRKLAELEALLAELDELSSKDIAELTAFIISHNKAEFAQFAE